MAFGCTVMLPPQHRRKPFKIHCAVSLNYHPILIDMNKNRRIIVAVECHNDILKVIMGDKKRTAQNTQADQIRKDKLS